MNRFFDIEGDLSVQLAPWELKKLNRPVQIALFRLESPLRYRSDIAGGILVVPRGYLSDLASIPKFAWSIFMASDDPRIELGAWVHDWLYQHQGVVSLEDERTTRLSRKDCDAILAHEAMPELSANAFQCAAVYRALRAFGRRWPGESFWK